MKCVQLLAFASVFVHAVIAASTNSSSSHGGKCKTNYVSVPTYTTKSGKQLVYYQSNPDRFHDSVHFCKKRGGSIVEPKTPEEWAEIKTFMAKYENAFSGFWIGASRRNDLSDFEFLSGGKLQGPDKSLGFYPWNYADFKYYFEQLPKDRSPNSPDLEYFFTGSVTGWSISTYSAYANPLCEYGSKVHLKNGEKEITVNGINYVLHLSNRTNSIEETKEYCAAQKGQMAVIKTEELYRELVNKLILPASRYSPNYNYGYRGMGSYFYNYWLPLRYNNVTKKIFWDDGTNEEVPQQFGTKSSIPWVASTDKCKGNYVYASNNGWFVTDSAYTTMNVMCSFDQCEKKPEQSSISDCKYRPTPSSSEVNIDNKKYILYRSSENYKLAMAACEERGGELATPDESTWKKLLTTFCFDSDSYSAKTFWLGFIRDTPQSPLKNVYNSKSVENADKCVFPSWKVSQEKLDYLKPNIAAVHTTYPPSWDIADPVNNEVGVLCEAGPGGRIRQVTTTEKEDSVEDTTGGMIEDFGKAPKRSPYYPGYFPTYDEANFTIGSKFYWYSSKRMNYVEAKQYCTEQGGKIATIHNNDENVKLITALNNVETYLGSPNFWIGSVWKEGKLISDDSEATEFQLPGKQLVFPPSDCLDSTSITKPRYTYSFYSTLDKEDKKPYNGRVAVYADNGRWVEAAIDPKSYSNNNYNAYICQYDQCPIA